MNSSLALVARGAFAARPCWWVAAGLALGPASTLGLARFAYALVLPAMRDDLGWSFAGAGTMSTANALGYLAGALVGAPLAARVGAQRTFVGGLGVTSVALLLSASTLDFGLLLALRLVAGVSGAVAFIAGASLAARASTGPTASVLAIYFGGAGVGILASSLVVPPLLGLDVPHAWRWAWLASGVLAGGSLPFAAAAAGHVPSPPSATGGYRTHWSPRLLAPVLAAYALFGAGYIAYMTFIVAHLRAVGLSDAVVSTFWAVLGLAAFGSAFGWGPLLGHLRGGRGPAAVLGITVVGAAVPLVWDGALASFVSAAVFGGSFMAGPTAVSALVRRVLPAPTWTGALATLTVAFAVGQIVGPLLAGVVADSAGGVRAALGVSVAVLAVAAAVALPQSEPAR